MSAPELVENRTFAEIAVGDSASLTRTLSQADIDLFAAASGDVNPAHLDPAFAGRTRFGHVIAHGMWSGALISSVLGNRLPGAGTIYRGQSLRFAAPVGVGDTITVTVTAREKRATGQIVLFDCRVVNDDGEEVASGTAEVTAPSEKLRQPALVPPEVSVAPARQVRPPDRAQSGHPADPVRRGASLRRQLAHGSPGGGT